MIKLRIDKLLHRDNKTIYWLAKETGMSYANTKRIVDGDTNTIRLENIEKFCKIFNVTPNELFEFDSNN